MERPLVPPSHPPALNVGRGVKFGAAVLIGVHLLRLLLSPDLDAGLMLHLGFQPIDFWVPGAGPVLPAPGLSWATPISYQILHADAMHLVLNTGFLLAFGSAVERRIGTGRFAGLGLLSGVAAAFGMLPGFVAEPAPTLLIGASGAISGLFGAMLHFAFRRPPHRTGGPSPALLAAFAFVLVNVLMGVTGMLASGTIRAIAWEAHIAGMVAGWLLFPLFDRRRRST